MAQRIQRRRTRGWRLPEGAVYVGRPTKWGNPWAFDDVAFVFGPPPENDWWSLATVEDARAFCVEQYRLHVGPFGLIEKEPEDWAEIRGRDLACWCALDVPCHADVLLEFANVPPAGGVS